MSSDIVVVVESDTSVVALSGNDTVVGVVESASCVVTGGEQGPAGAPGSQGIQGPQGLQGERGLPGPAGGATYQHNQLIPNEVWVIVHNLGRYCALSVLDSAGSLVIGDVVYNSADQITVTFSSAFGGTAYCV